MDSMLVKNPYYRGCMSISEQLLIMHPIQPTIQPIKEYNQASTLPAVFPASELAMDCLKEIFERYEENPTLETLAACERAVAYWSTAFDAKNAQIAACNEKLRCAAVLLRGAKS